MTPSATFLSNAAFTAWLESLPCTDGFFHVSPQRAYAHDEDQYDAQYGTVSEHPEEGEGLCSLLRQRGADTAGPALEIGCGTGYLTTGLARHCPYPILLVTDPSVAFLRLTSRRLRDGRRKSDHLRFAVLNGDDLPRVPAGLFSLIALRSTLHHILRVDEFIAGCSRLLRPGGVLAMGAEPCEEGYVLMGAMARVIPDVLQAAGVSLPPEWAQRVEDFCATIKFYCRRDLDKSAAEDKHLFRPHELSAVAQRQGLRFELLANASYMDFSENASPPARGTFGNFFPAYLRYCMSFDPKLVELIQAHLQPYFDYIDGCYSNHAGPVFNGVFLFTKSR